MCNKELKELKTELVNIKVQGEILWRSRPAGEGQLNEKQRKGQN